MNDSDVITLIHELREMYYLQLDAYQKGCIGLYQQIRPVTEELANHLHRELARLERRYGG